MGKSPESLSTLPSIGHLPEKIDGLAVIGHEVSETQEQSSCS
jgi:hypothetical protein